ncbi:MAG: hypothetical protein ACKOJF_02390, partial [Planctomycetaceae bacterium]
RPARRRVAGALRGEHEGKDGLEVVAGLSVSRVQPWGKAETGRQAAEERKTVRANSEGVTGSGGTEREILEPAGRPQRRTAATNPDAQQRPLGEQESRGGGAPIDVDHNNMPMAGACPRGVARGGFVLALGGRIG